MQPSYKPYFYVFFILIGLVFISLFLDSYALKILVLQEASLIEIPSAFGYFIAAGYFIYKGGISHLKKYFYIPGILIAMGMREMDFNSRFTNMGILKIRFFISPDIDIMQKIFAALALLVVAFLVILLIKNHVRQFMAYFRERDIVAVGSFITIATTVIAVFLDGLSRRLEWFNIFISTNANNRLTVLEEVTELGIPYFALITIYWYFTLLPTRNGK